MLYHQIHETATQNVRGGSSSRDELVDLSIQNGKVILVPRGEEDGNGA